MDVLQLIKKQHLTIRGLCEQLVVASAITEKRKIFGNLHGLLSIHCGMEADYLVPEISAVDSGACRAMEAVGSRHKLLLADLESVKKKVNKKPQTAKATLDKAIDNFTADVKSHLAESESELLPRIRQRIPTQDREDLGEALCDVVAVELESLGITGELGLETAAAI